MPVQILELLNPTSNHSPMQKDLKDGNQKTDDEKSGGRKTKGDGGE